MIRPGKMRHTITLQRVARVPDGYGTEAATWSDLATLRAELVKAEAAEVPTETAGTNGRRIITFRTRIFGGVTVADRVLWKGEALDLVEIVGGDFGEGRGLELRCEAPA